MLAIPCAHQGRDVGRMVGALIREMNDHRFVLNFLAKTFEKLFAGRSVYGEVKADIFLHLVGDRGPIAWIMHLGHGLRFPV